MESRFELKPALNS